MTPADTPIFGLHYIIARADPARRHPASPPTRSQIPSAAAAAFCHASSQSIEACPAGPATAVGSLSPCGRGLGEGSVYPRPNPHPTRNLARRFRPLHKGRGASTSGKLHNPSVTSGPPDKCPRRCKTLGALFDPQCRSESCCRQAPAGGGAGGRPHRKTARRPALPTAVMGQIEASAAGHQQIVHPSGTTMRYATLKAARLRDCGT